VEIKVRWEEENGVVEMNGVGAKSLQTYFGSNKDMFAM